MASSAPPAASPRRCSREQSSARRSGGSRRRCASAASDARPECVPGWGIRALVAGSAASASSCARPASPSFCKTWIAVVRATVPGARTRAAAASAAALGASAASGASALVRSDVGRVGAVAATRRGTTTSMRFLKRPSASAADTDSQVSVESSALSTTANDASSSYCTSTRSASVRTRRSGSRTASRSRADDLCEIEAGLGDERRRETAHGPEAHFGGRIFAELEQVRNSGGIARPEERPRRAPAHLGVRCTRPSNDRRDILARREPTDGEQRFSHHRRCSRSVRSARQDTAPVPPAPQASGFCRAPGPPRARPRAGCSWPSATLSARAPRRGPSIDR